MLSRGVFPTALFRRDKKATLNVRFDRVRQHVRGSVVFVVGPQGICLQRKRHRPPDGRRFGMMDTTDAPGGTVISDDREMNVLQILPSVKAVGGSGEFNGLLSSACAGKNDASH